MWTRGTVLGGRYTLTERVGGGAMGDVWRADDRVLERRVAVKILLPSLLEDEAFAARFRREAKVLATLDHPGIVDVHDYGEEEVAAGARVAYIVMEFIAGRPLDALLRERGPLPTAEALAIAAQTLDALHGAHRRDVVHRDIKPANLMVGEDGRVTVTDFGIARALTATKLTNAHEVLGTALYIAPESAEGIATVPASDLYSVGVVMHEMLTGECPFTGETLLEIMLKHIREPAPALPDGFPEPVRELVARALEKRPEDRFPSAAAMAEAARRAAAGQGAAQPGPQALPGGTDGADGAGGGAEEEGSGAASPADEGATPTGAHGAGARGVADGDAAVVPQAPDAPPGVEPVVVVAETPAGRDRRSRRQRFVLPLVIPLVIATTAGTVMLLRPVPDTSRAGGPSSPTASADVSPLSSASSTPPTGSASPQTPTASTSARSIGGGSGPSGGGSGGSGGGVVPAPTGGGSGTTGGTTGGTKGGTTTGSPSGGGSSGSAGSVGGSSSGGSNGAPGRIGSAGTYRIKDAADGGCLEQDTSSGAPSAYAVSRSCGSGPTPYAEWTFTPGPNGTFKVINQGSGDCLTAFMANGWANMDACGSTSGQYWQIGTRTPSGSTLESTTYWQCLQIAADAETAPCDSTQATQLWAEAGS